MTNAIKHGSLSVPGGRVSISWRRTNELENTVELKWLEENGPPAQKPTSKGFGTTVIDRLAGQQLGSEIKLSWRKSGLQMTMSIPEKNIAPASDDHDRTYEVGRSVSHDVLQGKKALIIDDEWLIAEQHADILAEAGAEVVGPFLRLEDAMKADIDDVDVAIVDYAMGDDDVLPLANRLKRAKVPIVFITGYGSNMHLSERFKEDLIVAKPAGASAVLDSAAWIVARYQSSE